MLNIEHLPTILWLELQVKAIKVMFISRSVQRNVNEGALLGPITALLGMLT